MTTTYNAIEHTHDFDAPPTPTETKRTIVRTYIETYRAALDEIEAIDLEALDQWDWQHLHASLESAELHLTTQLMTTPWGLRAWRKSDIPRPLGSDAHTASIHRCF